MGGLGNPFVDSMEHVTVAFLFCFVGATNGVEVNGSRQPKLFYISSSTTTSTVSTHSVCYHILSTSNAVSYGVTCSKRRKRRMITDGTAIGEISPSSRKAEVDSELGTQVESGDNEHRDKRYMNYWLTTTTTVTQYSYTVTSKIASLQCTPRIGWEYQSCPDPGR